MNVRLTERTRRVDFVARGPGGAIPSELAPAPDLVLQSPPPRDSLAPPRGGPSMLGTAAALFGGIAALAAGIFLLPANPVIGAIFCLLGGSGIFKSIRALTPDQ